MVRLPLTSKGSSLVAKPVSLGIADLRPQDEKTRAARRAFRVALVSMPFVTAQRPSMQIGLLKAIAETCGFSATTFHFAPDAARRVGKLRYERLAHFRGSQAGDWLFSVAAFGADAPDPGDEFPARFAQSVAKVVNEAGPTNFSELRREVLPALIDDLAASHPWGDYDVVGFTSTFQQSVASLALARRLKELYPKLTILFGGANLDGDMGLEFVRSMPMIDLAISGEADRSFPELLIALQEGRDVSEVPGVICRRDGKVHQGARQPPFEKLDELPTPDYDEFFERSQALGVFSAEDLSRSGVSFESARGCWWGAKHHCTFCGLNGGTMAFRAKSAERVRTELAEMARRYRTFHLHAADNIVDFGYLKTLFPGFRENRLGYDLFYEIKSNLNRTQLEELASAGVRRIQPGIESLSSHVLSLMRKGVTGIQNVNLLRWGRYYGVYVDWNMIWGFPGEVVADVEQVRALAPNLVHLQPPGLGFRLWLERFSPLFTDHESFPTEFVKPEASYAYVYPAGVDLAKIAYFFDYALHNTLPDEAYLGLSRELVAWKDLWGDGLTRPSLMYRAAPDFVQIEDGRKPGETRTYNLRGDEATVYLACSEEPKTLARLSETPGLSITTSDLEQWLLEFCERGLMMRDGEKFLSLAVPAQGAAGTEHIQTH